MGSFNHSVKKAFGMLLATVTAFSIFFQPFKGPAGTDRPGIVLCSEGEGEKEEQLPLHPTIPFTH